MLHIIIIILISMLPSTLWAQDPYTLFDEKELNAIKQSAEELVKRQKVAFNCEVGEPHGACIARSCGLSEIDLLTDDLMQILSSVGNFTDEQILCIYLHSDEGKAAVAIRNAFKEILQPNSHRQISTNVDQTSADEETSLQSILDEIKGENALTEPAYDSPPLTFGEKDSFTQSISECWTIDRSSPAASVIITVSFELDQNGKVLAESITLVEATNDISSEAVTEAFLAAKRAIFRCQRGGFDLPSEKYQQWKDVQITFDPTQMRQ